MKMPFQYLKVVLGIALLANLVACFDKGEKPESNIENAALEEPFNAAAAWQEFESLLRLHYAYLERDDFDVDAQLLRSRKLASSAKTDAEFRRILNRTAYAFTDPHFIVGPFEASDYNIIPTSSDLKVRWDGGKLIVVDVRQASAAANARIQAGWFVTKIDGDDPMVASLKPFGDVVTGLTEKQLNYGANLAVNGHREGSRKISLLTHHGQEREFTLSSPRDFARAVTTFPMIASAPYGEIVIQSKNDMPAENIGVLRINNQLGNNALITEFDKAIESVMDTDGLILDLRNTPSGGNTEVARSIIGHFIKETRSYQVHEIPSLEREFSVPRRFVEQVKPREPFYDQPVVVLGGHWTGSMGEGLVIGMDAAANAYTIVSDMGDLLGGLRNFTLDTSFARIDFGNEALFHIGGTPREDFRGDIYLVSSDDPSNSSTSAMKEARRWLESQAQK